MRNVGSFIIYGLSWLFKSFISIIKVEQAWTKLTPLTLDQNLKKFLITFFLVFVMKFLFLN